MGGSSHAPGGQPQRARVGILLAASPGCWAQPGQQKGRERYGSTSWQPKPGSQLRLGCGGLRLAAQRKSLAGPPLGWVLSC